MKSQVDQNDYISLVLTVLNNSRENLEQLLIPDKISYFWRELNSIAFRCRSASASYFSKSVLALFICCLKNNRNDMINFFRSHRVAYGTFGMVNPSRLLLSESVSLEEARNLVNAIYEEHHNNFGVTMSRDFYLPMIFSSDTFDTESDILKLLYQHNLFLVSAAKGTAHGGASSKVNLLHDLVHYFEFDRLFKKLQIHFNFSPELLFEEFRKVVFFALHSEELIPGIFFILRDHPELITFYLTSNAQTLNSGCSVTNIIANVFDFAAENLWNTSYFATPHIDFRRPKQGRDFYTFGDKHQYSTDPVSGDIINIKNGGLPVRDQRRLVQEIFGHNAEIWDGAIYDKTDPCVSFHTPLTVRRKLLYEIFNLVPESYREKRGIHLNRPDKASIKSYPDQVAYNSRLYSCATGYLKFVGSKLRVQEHTINTSTLDLCRPSPQESQDFGCFFMDFLKTSGYTVRGDNLLDSENRSLTPSEIEDLRGSAMGEWEFIQKNSS